MPTRHWCLNLKKQQQTATITTKKKVTIFKCFVCWRASETLSGVTQLKIGDICYYIYVDIRMSFCTLTLAFLCLLCGLFLPVPPLN